MASTLLNVINVWMILYSVLITPGNAVYEYFLVPPFSSYVLVLPVTKNMNVLYKIEVKTKTYSLLITEKCLALHVPVN